MSIEKEWFIEAPWGRLCIIAWGECSSPPVLLCHGQMDSAATFRPLVKLLPKDFYYIAVELPGHGRSARYPPGIMVSSYDLVYVIELMARHFRWDRFRFVGHSLGAMLGIKYERAYPGKISHLVLIDPVTKPMAVPADKFADCGVTLTPCPDMQPFGKRIGFEFWTLSLSILKYHFYFTNYYEKYEEYNVPKENGPLYSWQEAVDKLIQKRKLTVAAAEDTLVRITEPAGGDKIRFTFDQRMKLITGPPLSPDSIKSVYTTLKPSTLVIAADSSIKGGGYSSTPVIFEESQFPLKNYRVRTVEGTHDVHFVTPERVAGYVGQFLLYGVEGLDSKPKL